jgi:hypothetical protein
VTLRPGHPADRAAHPDGDIDAIGVLYNNSTAAEKAMIRKEIDPSDLSSGDQEAQLKAIFAR